ncbi:DUF2780 domain-containing protein [Vibrio coralliilyticus]|uniref:DUF2780 domain-containing protein n=1 Tax=Vibrio coralliilyticus TaxID=190893 RepID=UPI000BAAFD97|nr:DUF2780 domain-containing protein [Vibrio coralliilyticus]NOI58312.1 DUF2780 domain-containing protein [Vibrio coralliilyticus]PAT67544.1 hypothetical protein CKA27_14735 [Vibrio coralliilyticus]
MTKALLLLPLLLSTSFSSYAFLNLGKESPDSSALTSVISEKLSNTQSQSPLTDALTSNLSISGEQAATGSAALLSLAQNQLPANQSEELTGAIPGLSSLSSLGGIAGQVDSMSAVSDIFAKIGLDPSMISQFTPVILEYLSGQGASSGLMTSLEELWKE